MRFFTLLVSVFTITSTAFSQHYQTVYAGQNVNFTTYRDRNAIPTYIDSVDILPNTVIFYSPKYSDNYDMYDNGCLNIEDTIWIGNKIIIKQNGEEVYFNELGDSIFLYPRKEVGESWAMTTLKDGYFLEATITQKEFTTFMGLTDSVKTITIQAKDSIGNPIVHILNQKTLQVSQHHGWIEGRDFRTMPHATHRSDTISFKIIGKNDGQTGVYNIGFNEIFNFQIGDVFHEKEYSGSSFDSDDHFIYDKKQVLGKSTVGDTLAYTIKLERLELFLIYNDTTNSYDSVINRLIDTTQIVYTRHRFHYIDTLPYHLALDTFSLWLGGGVTEGRISYISYNEEFSKIEKFVSGSLRDDGGNPPCWNTAIDADNAELYYEGLGGPFFHCGSVGGSVHYRKLLYYKKGNVEEGDSIKFHVILPTEKIITTKPLIQLYPNPTSSTLNLKILQNYPENASVSIRNILGQQVMVIHNPKQTEIIDVSELSNGVYFVSLELEGAVYTEELVIQK